MYELPIEKRFIRDIPKKEIWKWLSENHHLFKPVAGVRSDSVNTTIYATNPSNLNLHFNWEKYNKTGIYIGYCNYIDQIVFAVAT